MTKVIIGHSLPFLLLVAAQVAHGFLSSPNHKHINNNPRLVPITRYATVEDQQKVLNTDSLLDCMSSSSSSAAKQWAEMFGLGEAERGFYALFEGIRKEVPIGLNGSPFVLRKDQVQKALGMSFDGFFTFQDLEKAVNDDFLDAGRGTTDNRKGWKMATVSNPRGNTFDEARLTFEDVQAALEKGTVIFNSAGAHIPKLAGPSLACTDATILPNALNMYVTAPQKRTSAPPHTDKQDVIVVQTSGKKHWKVYSPPLASQKPSADMFARGKGDDNLPLFALESEFGCELLLETTLEEGDVLFIPAAFPHTTDTAEEGLDTTSIHLTFGLDTHIWDLDYLSVRRWALKRCQVSDTKLGQMGETENKYVGVINQLPSEQIKDLLDALPMGFLDDDAGEAEVNEVCSELVRISKELDPETFAKAGDDVWMETTERIQQHGKELLDLHRDMYLAAIEEGRLRVAEAAMTAHVEQEGSRKTLTPEQMQRLSVFRVKRFFDKIETIAKSLFDWSYAGKASAGATADNTALPENWAFTMPVKVGDTVEADLGGAFFPATIARVAGNTYDVLFFDGDRDTGLERSMIKLLVPPKNEADSADTSKMTPKQLKRWKKQQEQKSKK